MQPNFTTRSTQEHLIICSKPSRGTHLNMLDIFAAEIKKQAAIAKRQKGVRAPKFRVGTQNFRVPKSLE